MTQNAETDQSRTTDPRYHAAYQRGYDGPEPERLTRAEERFRRPRRAAAAPAPVRERRAVVPEAAVEPAAAPSVPQQPAASLGSGVPEEPAAAEAVAPQPRAPIIGRRVPVTLVVVGLVLATLGPLGTWWSMNSIYSDTVYVDGVDPERYIRLVLQYASPPALTVGLLCLGGAVVAQLLRATRS